jgi:hypothetical protein
MKKCILLLGVTALLLFSCKKQEVKEVVTKESQASLSEGESVNEFSTLATTIVNVTPTTVLNTAFWSNIQTLLQSNPVDVVFADGTYNLTSTISLNNIGHATNNLELKCATGGSAVITGSIAKLMGLSYCKNILIHRLKFTGAVTDYALTIQRSQDVTVAYCRFENMPNVYYGAVGAHYATSDNIIVRQNYFANVGVGSTAHMIYGAYGVTRLKVINNTFKDCAGAFVRFRGDNSTHGVVYGNTFTSTGTYLTGVNPIFVEVPVFNDVNPGDEKFGTSFMVTANNFTYSTSGSQSTRYAMVFHHSGYNPTGRTHLISVADATTLGSGSSTVAAKRAIMSTKLGLDGTKILFGGNTNSNVAANVSYRCQGGYGAVAPWTGVVSIGTAVTASGVATSYADALTFYDDLY